MFLQTKADFIIAFKSRRSISSTGPCTSICIILFIRSTWKEADGEDPCSDAKVTDDKRQPGDGARHAEAVTWWRRYQSVSPLSKWTLCAESYVLRQIIGVILFFSEMQSMTLWIGERLISTGWMTINWSYRNMLIMKMRMKTTRSMLEWYHRWRTKNYRSKYLIH